MAGQSRASLLLIPSHDHPRDVVHRAHGFRHIAELARKTRIKSLVALGSDFGISVSLHRQHAWLDDGGTWTATMVDLRTLSHARWLQQSCQQRRRDLHTDRIRRTLFRSWIAFPRSNGS